jgi:hypothetical protein
MRRIKGSVLSLPFVCRLNGTARCNFGRFNDRSVGGMLAWVTEVDKKVGKYQVFPLQMREAIAKPNVWNVRRIRSTFVDNPQQTLE